MRPRVRRTTSERRILDATLELLRDGARFTDLPVEQILVSAEISRSTFYSYFADKNELLMRLAEPFIAAYTGLADTWWQRDSSTDEATWQELAELNEDFIGVARAHREVFAALTDLGGGDSSQPRALRHLTDQYAQRMAERLVREQSDGLVSADVIPVVTARFIITATFAAIRDHLERDDTVESDDIALARTLGHAFWFAMYGTVGHRDLQSHALAGVGKVWDSPNSAGVIIDAVRAAKIAKDRGIGGPVVLHVALIGAARGLRS